MFRYAMSPVSVKSVEAALMLAPVIAVPFQTPVVIVPSVMMYVCPTYASSISTIGLTGSVELTSIRLTVPTTESTWPPLPPAGTAQVPSALRKLTVPPPDRGTSPLSVSVNTGRNRLT